MGDISVGERALGIVGLVGLGWFTLVRKDIVGGMIYIRARQL